MTYYKNTKEEIYAYEEGISPSDTTMIKITSPIKEDGTLLPRHSKLSEVEMDELGNHYKYYNQDGTPDVDRIEAEATLAITTASNNEALQYLTSTDWYITRQIETGVEVPQDIIDARAKAREDIVNV